MESIKTVKHELARLLDEDAQITAKNVHVHSSRKLPMDFDRELCVFSVGSAPSQSKVLDNSNRAPVYNFIIQFFIKYSADNFDETEDVSLDLENDIYRILGEEYYTHSMWKKIVFPGFSQKPIGTGNTQNLHLGRIQVRVLL